MPITNAMSVAYAEDVQTGVHQPGDTYKIALIKPSPAGTFDRETLLYSELGSDEVANGNGYTTGGATLSGRSVARSGNALVLDFANPVWSAATISAAGAMVYNTTRSNRVLGIFSFGGTITSTNGDFTVNIPSLLRITT
jgi:hypothetical protein